MKKNTILFFIFLSILVTSIQQITFAGNITFPDAKYSWSRSYIEKLAEKKIMNGYTDGTFKPDNKVTVYEFTTILIKALGHNPPASTEGNWYDSYINKAMELSIIKEGEFSDYTKHINRVEAARMITRMIGKETEAVEWINKKEENLNYSNIWGSDIQDVPYELRVYIKTIRDNDLMRDHEMGKFFPYSPLTRADVAKLFYMAITKINKDFFKSYGAYKTLDQLQSIDLGPLTDNKEENSKKLFNTLGLKDGYLWESHGEDFSSRKIYYANVNDLPVKVGNVMVRGVEIKHKDKYNGDIIAIKLTNLLDERELHSSVGIGLIDSKYFRPRRICNFSNEDGYYNYFYDLYPDFSGLSGLTQSIMPNQDYTAITFLQEPLESELIKNVSKPTKSSIDKIAIFTKSKYIGYNGTIAEKGEQPILIINLK
ncbi:hypothetical protein HNQ80_004136 [Anaerosolibacter carboniphilus]|uniref:SLH domain-containing protein n=1 Tax=Anaerosolibacter carboniphilus TaxID=1417629 RepID=A0A841L6I0_9FIRM|nr:S-layer homology domain-containing protein [Anaerosolibacter carboniphilus]MBB6217999.1 hypothetical protein [Anaerosolibacter carboniphilus]